MNRYSQGIDTFTHYLYRMKVSVLTLYRYKSIDTYLCRITMNIFLFIYKNYLVSILKLLGIETKVSSIYSYLLVSIHPYVGF